jgi:hypothetical protein
MSRAELSRNRKRPPSSSKEKSTAGVGPTMDRTKGMAATTSPKKASPKKASPSQSQTRTQS